MASLRGPAVAGNPRVEAVFAFDRALAQQRRSWLIRWLRRPAGSPLPVLEDLVAWGQLSIGPVLERTVRTADVVGTVASGHMPFDDQFRPTGRDARGRFQNAFAAMFAGLALPPVELVQWRGRLYVSDGHHRVAAARALGQEFLDARVTLVLDPDVPRQRDAGARVSAGTIAPDRDLE